MKNGKMKMINVYEGWKKEGIARIPRVDRVDIQDFRIIQEAHIEFGPKLNIIIGRAGGGKTSVLEYLIKSLNLEELSIGKQIEFQIQQEINPGCFLIDDLLCRFSQKDILRILKDLECCGRQVIVTLHWERLKDIKDKINAKIINMDDFKLKVDY